jgi:uncharacterized membrane protein YfcA
MSLLRPEGLSISGSVLSLGRGLAVGSVLLAGGAAFLIGFSKTGIPGAGMPAIALMAAAFREETKLSVGAMVPLLIVGDVFAVAYYRRHANWHRLLELLPYIVLGMVPGYLVLQYANSESLRSLIGGIILLLLGLHFARLRFHWERIPDRWWFIATMGLLAGFGTIVGNAAGPAMSIYLLSKKLDKHEFIGTSAWLFFLVNVSKIPFQLAMGVITLTTLRLDLCVAPVLVVGALVGVAVHKRIPQRAFNSVVLLLAAVAALHMVLF